ncbi:GAF domain-containing protein [Enterovibrio norvegicus FF-162]|uniref:GAF domain-containing protein n=1 Tax=Enterovibrio norvegicus FF-454 TaxID=1185651 RepID=A0A1E5C9L6_9GAMM|nr:GAF domain-containing protein [Enterovibrio norvegicus]OEE62218.1 GAF domain-containing protein [Enterovibrio norvegicus FF-454]OEE89165.1 GAF domain-containing protein [Enterovibrio norvegicus FF-162]
MDSKTEFYALLSRQAVSLIENESNLIANLANVSALLFQSLDDINWAGFYLDDGEELVLGPFQGNTACVRIPYQKGVCGSAFSHKRVERIADVHLFDGHIACDAQSNSEIVLPLYKGEKLLGVLDIDSPKIARFDHHDETGLTLLVNELQKHL